MGEDRSRRRAELDRRLEDIEARRPAGWLPPAVTARHEPGALAPFRGGGWDGEISPGALRAAGISPASSLRAAARRLAEVARACGLDATICAANGGVAVYTRPAGRGPDEPRTAGLVSLHGGIRVRRVPIPPQGGI